MSRTDFGMEGRCNGIPCFYFFKFFIVFIFLFLFRSNGIKEHLDKNDFHHGYVNYFKNAVLKVTSFQHGDIILNNSNNS